MKEEIKAILRKIEPYFSKLIWATQNERLYAKKKLNSKYVYEWRHI